MKKKKKETSVWILKMDICVREVWQCLPLIWVTRQHRRWSSMRLTTAVCQPLVVTCKTSTVREAATQSDYCALWSTEATG